MGWRLVAGLTARAVVTFGVPFIPARPRAGRGAPGLGGERPSDRASALGGLRPGRPTAARGPRARGHGRARLAPAGRRPGERRPHRRGHGLWDSPDRLRLPRHPARHLAGRAADLHRAITLPHRGAYSLCSPPSSLKVRRALSLSCIMLAAAGQACTSASSSVTSTHPAASATPAPVTAVKPSTKVDSELRAPL